jgi:hypothetical protein
MLFAPQVKKECASKVNAGHARQKGALKPKPTNG